MLEKTDYICLKCKLWYMYCNDWEWDHDLLEAWGPIPIKKCNMVLEHDIFKKFCKYMGI